MINACGAVAPRGARRVDGLLFCLDSFDGIGVSAKATRVAATAPSIAARREAPRASFGSVDHLAGRAMNEWFFGLIPCRDHSILADARHSVQAWLIPCRCRNGRPSGKPAFR